MSCPKLVSILGLPLAFVSTVAAGDIKSAANFTLEQPRWSISAGAMVRSIDADFHVAKPAPLTWQSLFRAGSPRAGDAGVYRGGLGAAHYSDGSVGPDYGLVFDIDGLPTGDAGGLIHSGGQLSNSGRVDSFGVPIFDLNYHSSGTSTNYGSASALHGLDASDSDVGVGPYITLSYLLRSGAKDSLSVSIGWSLVQTQHGISGALGVETITAQTARNRYSYQYDYDGAGGALLPGAQFPYNASQLGEGFIIYDPAAYSNAGGGEGFLPPRRSVQSSRSSGIAATLVPVATTRLSVTLNEVVFAAQYQRRLTERLRLGLSLGPTLNVIDSGFDAAISWYANGGGKPVASVSSHTSSTDVKIGLMGQVSVLLDLTGQIFLEVHGSYRWVDPVNVGGSLASVRVNPSSWEGGLGLGLRF